MCARTIPGANDGGFRLPASDGYWAVVDGGGSFFGVVIFADNGALMVSTRVSTTGYSRVDDVVLDVFRSFGETHGVIPRRVVLALAGPIDKRRRTVTLLKNRDWAVFDLDEFCRRTGCVGKLFNDVELQAADAAHTPDEHLEEIKPGSVWPAGRVAALTWSTGINAAFAQGRSTAAFELGQITVGGTSPLERSYIRYVRGITGKPWPTIEDLVGGLAGFDRAAAWFLEQGHGPQEETEAALRGHDKALGEGIGPVITSHLHDPFCQAVVNLIGGLWGEYTRHILVALQPDAGLHLVGGVAHGAMSVVASPAHSPFLERITDPHLPYADRVADFRVVVNRDPKLPFRGGLALARRLV